MRVDDVAGNIWQAAPPTTVLNANSVKARNRGIRPRHMLLAASSSRT